jgi:hypothetical protein
MIVNAVSVGGRGRPALVTSMTSAEIAGVFDLARRVCALPRAQSCNCSCLGCNPFIGQPRIHCGSESSGCKM